VVVEPPRPQRWLLLPRKEHRKKVRVIRPRQSEAEAGHQRNYGELPYVGVQSVPSPLPRAQASFELNEP
jgi:hypothetical protein